jgi:ubiquinone/menaquinone biosynthesis C-methylase UbiE
MDMTPATTTTATTTVDTTYHRFSRDSEYVRANAAFVDRLPLEGTKRILDLACGNGAVGRLLLARAPGSSLTGVDRDPVQIELASKEYADLGYRVKRVEFGDEVEMTGATRTVNLMVGAVEDLALPERGFDFANIANAIHLIGDKTALLTAIARVLEPGGIFAFSSGFYAGCWPAVTQQVYYEWVKGATAWIAQLSAARVAAGEAAIRRVRGKSQVATVAYQNRWLTPDEWRALLADCGLDVQDLHEREVWFDHDSLASVGAYSGLAEAQLAGYPSEIASQALAETARAALDSAGVDRVQHNWIEVCARRRG